MSRGGRNYKSEKLRIIRDQLGLGTKRASHLPGLAPSFAKSLDLIGEMVSIVRSPRLLGKCKKEIVKIRERFPELELNQVKAIAGLEQRLEEKIERIRLQNAGKPTKQKKPTPAAPTPAPQGGTSWLDQI